MIRKCVVSFLCIIFLVVLLVGCTNSDSDSPQPNQQLNSNPSGTINDVCQVDQDCNGDPSVSALWGSCNADHTCSCNEGFKTSSATGKCMVDEYIMPREWTQIKWQDEYSDFKYNDLQPGCIATLDEDGSPTDPEFSFFVKGGTTNKLVVYFEGGGACWDKGTCITGSTCTKEIGTTPEGLSEAGGMFSENDDNPFKDWSFIHIPYCTGDIHMGANDMDYGDTLFEGSKIAQHRGAVNFHVVLAWMKDHIDEPDAIFITGSSAGAYGAAFHFPYIREAYPGSIVNVLADAGVGVAIEDFQVMASSNWNFQLPGDLIEELKDANFSEITVADGIIAGAKQYPEDRFAAFTTEEDVVQVMFFGMGKGILALINEYLITKELTDEWQGIMYEYAQRIVDKTENFKYYTAETDYHTIMGSSKFYEEASAKASGDGENKKFLTWVKDMLNPDFDWNGSLNYSPTPPLKWKRIYWQDEYPDFTYNGYQPACVARPKNDGKTTDPDFNFFFKQGRTNNIVVYFQGGGACWNKGSCVSVTTYYPEVTTTPKELTETSGLFSNKEENPFVDWSYVFIPYCTGDIHMGANDKDYAEPMDKLLGRSQVIQHRGAVNFQVVLKWMKDHVSTPDKIFVSGSSAGAYGASFNFPYLKDAYPESRVYVLADAGCGVTTDDFRATISDNWNFQIPGDFIPSLAGVDLSTITIAYAIEEGTKAYPDERFAQFTTEEDFVQVLFYGLGKGLPQLLDEFLVSKTLTDEWNGIMVQYAEEIEQNSENFKYYTATGNYHTIMRDTVFYEEDSAKASGEEGENKLFLDWVKDLLDDDFDWNGSDNYSP